MIGLIDEIDALLDDAGGEVLLSCPQEEGEDTEEERGMAGDGDGDGGGDGDAASQPNAIGDGRVPFARLRSSAHQCKATISRVSPCTVLVRQNTTPLGTPAGPRGARGAQQNEEARPRGAHGRGVIEVRVAVVGNVDSGKSTLVGCLTRCVLDDGRGLARSKVFRHAHEAETGRTSSVAQHTLCLDASGATLNLEGHRAGSEREAVAKAAKVITLVDLAGHEKYFKTTGAFR